MSDLREETEKLLAEWPMFAAIAQASEHASIYEMAWLCDEDGQGLLAAAPRLLRAWMARWAGECALSERLEDENASLRRELEAAREENERLRRELDNARVTNANNADATSKIMRELEAASEHLQSRGRLSRLLESLYTPLLDARNPPRVADPMRAEESYVPAAIARLAMMQAELEAARKVVEIASDISISAHPNIFIKLSKALATYDAVVEEEER